MGRNLSQEELTEHKDAALKKLDAYLTNLINDQEKKVQSKSDKLSYWLEDWTTFLDFESEFSPTSLRRYKRGEIVKAHLGYNIGSEEGGLHYCVVIDKNNSRNSPVVTIVPLTSIKSKTDVKHLHKCSVYLGNELFRNLNSKISYSSKHLMEELDELETLVKENDLEKTLSDQNISDLSEKLAAVNRRMDLLDRMRIEVSKMRIGSIALVNQVRTISKIRIYDPKTNLDVLSNIKLTNEKLDMIDNEIIHNFKGCK